MTRRLALASLMTVVLALPGCGGNGDTTEKVKAKTEAVKQKVEQATEPDTAAAADKTAAAPAAGTHPAEFLSPDAADNNAQAKQEIRQQRIADEFHNFPR